MKMIYVVRRFAVEPGDKAMQPSPAVDTFAVLYVLGFYIPGQTVTRQTVHPRRDNGTALSLIIINTPGQTVTVKPFIPVETMALPCL